jgi:flagellum-specific peptidoglycan hydrolase FlgJ
MTPEQKSFLDTTRLAAMYASHPFPAMAACEAALESAWGKSLLAIQDFNLFGMKAHSHAVEGTVNLPTKEFLGGSWVTVMQSFIHYPDLTTCFADRKATLVRLANMYPHYRAALQAPDAETYIREVSKTWSTDPDRATKVLAIYQEYARALNDSQ